MRKTLIKRKKSGKSRRRRTRKMVKRGGVYPPKRKADTGDSGPPLTKKTTIDQILLDTGDNIRFNLVQLWKKGKLDEYNGLVDSLLDNNEISNIARNELIKHLDIQIKTFRLESLLALEKFFIKLDVINKAKSKEYLKVLFEKYAVNEKINMPTLVKRLIQYHLTNNTQAYDDITQKIINDFRNYGTKEFFDYLDENIKIGKDKDGKTIIVASTFSEEQLLALLKTLTQIQEDAVAYGNSMAYLEAISNMANKLQPPSM